jgi:prophage DNA circulation protein
MSGGRAFTGLAKAGFLGIEFRVDSIAIKGGLRKYVHTYPHAPGGKPEKLGRKLYEITMSGIFLVNDPVFPTAHPGDIGMLRAQFENEVTGDLVIPTVGTIQAYATDWDIENTAKIMNGERMKISFEEDQDIQQFVNGPLVLTYTNVDAKYAAFAAEVTKAGLSPSLFQSLADLVSEIQGLKDQFDLQTSILVTKTQQLADECRLLDTDVADLQKPLFWPVVNALHDLGVAADNLNRDILRKLAPIGLYIVPREMVISQVATSIYGDTSRAVEIMQLNPIDDPFSIQPGTELRYYQSAA